METTTEGFIGTTIRIHFFIPTLLKARKGLWFAVYMLGMLSTFWGYEHPHVILFFVLGG